VKYINIKDGLKLIIFWKHDVRMSVI